VGRINLRDDTAEVLARIDCCIAAHVDAIFLIGRATPELLSAIHAKTELPLFTAFPDIAPEELIRLGVRLQMAGHQGYFVMLGALWDYYLARKAGQPGEALRDKELPAAQRQIAFAEQDYNLWTQEFLAIDPKGPQRL
jgi:2-methylisocitrate lyase-like PEP mutase family enzyme